MRPSLPVLLLLAGVSALPLPCRAESEVPLCDYDIALIEQEGWSLDVAIACRTPVEGFAFADDSRSTGSLSSPMSAGGRS